MSNEDARLIAITGQRKMAEEILRFSDLTPQQLLDYAIELGAILAAKDQQIAQLQRELDIANFMLVGEKGLLNERMLAVAAVEHDYVQKLELKNEQIARLQQGYEVMFKAGYDFGFDALRESSRDDGYREPQAAWEKYNSSIRGDK